MQTYSKQDIQKLGLSDPIVRAHLDACRLTQGISWEQMLHSLVVCLVEAKDAAIAQSIDYAKRIPPGGLLTDRLPPPD